MTISGIAQFELLEGIIDVVYSDFCVVFVKVARNSRSGIMNGRKVIIIFIMFILLNPFY